MLNLVISRNACLPHALNPRLTMALTGRLSMGGYSRSIVAISVSLVEGLSLWTKDAIEAHRRHRPTGMVASCDPNYALPGGRYTLPLTVQIPNLKLPPTFQTPNGKFAVTYELGVSLTCDNLAKHGSQFILADVARSFTLLPLTLPQAPPVIAPLAQWLEQPESESEWCSWFGDLPIAKRYARWQVQPSM